MSNSEIPRKKIAKRLNSSLALQNNQNARKWFPDQLAIDLDAWSKRDDARWLGDFLLEHEIDLPDYLTRFANESELFAKSLRLAKFRIASRIRNQVHDESYNVSVFHREIGMYDMLLKAHDREEKEFEASLKDKLEKNVSEDAIANAKAVLDMIASYQKP